MIKLDKIEQSVTEIENIIKYRVDQEFCFVEISYKTVFKKIKIIYLKMEKEELLKVWDEGWNCFLSTLNELTSDQLHTIIYIRNEGHTVVEAINRQLAHYPYHIGQIVFIGKLLCNENWTSLSIPKGNSKEYNADKFAKPKHKQHFTDEYINEKKLFR